MWMWVLKWNIVATLCPCLKPHYTLQWCVGYIEDFHRCEKLARKRKLQAWNLLLFGTDPRQMALPKNVAVNWKWKHIQLACNKTNAVQDGFYTVSVKTYLALFIFVLFLHSCKRRLVHYFIILCSEDQHRARRWLWKLHPLKQFFKVTSHEAGQSAFMQS